MTLPNESYVYVFATAPVGVACQDIPGVVHFLNDIRSDVLPVIEVVGGAERTGFLDSSAEGIVLEGHGSRARHKCLRKPVFEVPGVGFSGGIGEGIAVCVIDNCEHGCHS